jgi:hypothetical protein
MRSGIPYGPEVTGEENSSNTSGDVERGLAFGMQLLSSVWLLSRMCTHIFSQLLISLMLASDSSSCRSLGRTTLSECLSSSQMMPGSHSLCSSFFVNGTGFDPIIGENLGQPRNTTFLNPDNTSAIVTLPQGMFPFLMLFLPFFLLYQFQTSLSLAVESISSRLLFRRS